MSRQAIFLGVVAVAAAALLGYLAGFQADRVVVFGDTVSEAAFLEKDEPARAFARFVEERLRARLVTRFDIDTSDDGLTRFLEVEAPDLLSAEKTQADQRNAGRVADALDAVLSGMSPSLAYEEFGLEGAIDETAWKTMAGNDAEPGIVRTMREFAAAPVTQLQTATRETMRSIYLDRRIKAAICRQPEQAKNIRENLAATGGRNDGAAAFRCAVEVNDFIRAELDANVEFEDAALDNYTRYITLLDPVTDRMRPDSG